MSELAGERNAYTCGVCHKTLITVIVHDGVTPAYLGCKATPGCGGQMTSQWYRSVPDGPADLEWFRPKRLNGYGAEMKDHIRRGGLVWRRAPNAGGEGRE